MHSFLNPVLVEVQPAPIFHQKLLHQLVRKGQNLVPDRYKNTVLLAKVTKGDELDIILLSFQTVARYASQNLPIAKCYRSNCNFQLELEQTLNNKI